MYLNSAPRVLFFLAKHILRRPSHSCKRHTNIRRLIVGTRRSRQTARRHGGCIWLKSDRRVQTGGYVWFLSPLQNEDLVHFSTIWFYHCLEGKRVDRLTGCWQTYRLLTDLQAVDRLTGCWQTYRLLTDLQAVDRLTGCWQTYRLLTDSPGSWLEVVGSLAPVAQHLIQLLAEVGNCFYQPENTKTECNT